MWAYPGGKIGEGESPTTAILREILEETGLTIRPDEIHFFYEGLCTNKDPADTPYWVYSFEIRTARQLCPTPMPGEPPFQWMTPADFLTESAFPEFNAETLRQARIPY
jgi:8-oxo-dGTP pyrophosphatase MutT (NUDIX family)